MITYSSDRKITFDQLIQALLESTLAGRRPLQGTLRK